MADTVHFVPDAFLREGPSTVQDMVRLARTQAHPTPSVSSVIHTLRDWALRSAR